jgi:hypothetical protein
MGKKNPIEQAVTGVADATLIRPTRDIANAVGAQGVADGIDQAQGRHSELGNQVLDMASGDAKKKKEEAHAGTARDEARAASAAADEAKRLGLAENARIEGERMSQGSKSRTLLTGPAGLGDEAGGMSRRTLQGRRRA